MTRTLARTFCTLALAAAAATLSCKSGPDRAPPAGTSYTLTGTLSIENRCGGGPAAIPARVQLSAALEDAAGNNSITGNTTVNLAPAGAGKSGAFSISVTWPRGIPAPKHWTTYRVKVDGRDLCPTFPCADGRCDNLAQQTREPVPPPSQVPAAGHSVRHDIQVRCECH